jgi:uncharacterized membrane protein
MELGERLRRERESVTSPAREDPFVGGLAEVIGGARGDHAVPETVGRGGRFWTAARIVLALTCLTLALHWIQKSPCRDGAWQDLEQYKSFCYTDVLALYYFEGLSEGKVPYVPDGDNHQVEYPVLTGAFMGLIGLPVHAFGQNNPNINQGQVFYDVTALALMAFAVATAALIISLRRRRPWDAAMFALSPALLVTATVNWDFLAIVLAIGGLWCWARRHPLAAGILLGLGAAAKLWPAFLLWPILALAMRSKQWQPAALAVGGAAGAWLLTNVPVMLLSFTDWYRFMQLSSERAIDWGTLWYIGRFLDTDYFGGALAGFYGNIPVVTNLALVLFILGTVIGITRLVTIAPVPPRLAQLAFLVIALFLVTSKVWSQQFNLWLLPLIVLARPKWGAFLFWQVAEVGYFLAFYAELMNASGQNVIPEGTFVFASFLRLASVILLMVLVIREIMQPELDVVRTTYAGGDPDSPLRLKMTASSLSSRFKPRPSTGAVSAPS